MLQLQLTRPTAMLPLIVSFLLLAANSASAQNRPYTSEAREELWRVGAYGAAQWFGYQAEMGELPGVPSCCPRYRDGSGEGFAVGADALAPITRVLSGGLRLLFVQYNGVLEAEEQELVTAERDTATAVFGHSIALSQPMLSTEATLALQAIPDLRILAGARIDVRLGGSFRQEERIISPENIRFENGHRTRMVYEGEIPREAVTHFALLAGVRYDIPLNAERTLIISPELQFWQGTDDLVTGRDLTMRGARLGLSLYHVRRAYSLASSPLEPARR